MTYPAIQLATIPTTGQKEVVFNQNCEALAKCAAFALKHAVKLQIELYGGNLLAADGSIVQVANTKLTLTASVTNYIQLSAGGVVTVVTAAPSGWPGPLAGGARALYAIVCGANSITSATNYLTMTSPGPTGAQGPQGPAGDEMWLQRRRVYEQSGFGSTALIGNTADYGGFDVTTSGSPNSPTFNSRTADSSTFLGGIPHTGMTDSSASASSVQALSQAFCTMGNAAGRGGFKVDMRWAIDATFGANATMRSFFGLIDPACGTVGANDPSSLVNMVGVGADAADANLSIFCNDGSGTATKTTLGANFPARGSDNVYELTLQTAGNSGSVTYTLVNKSSGNSATGALSSNVPAATAFLAWLILVGKTNSSSALINFIQVTSYQRY